MTQVTQWGSVSATDTLHTTVEKTRPADTTAYGAEDVISESATNGEGTAWVFAIPFGVRASGYITKALIHTKAAGVTAACSLFLFNALPTSELDDNAANTAPDYEDLEGYQGRIDFPGMEDLGGDSSWAQATPSTAGQLPLMFQCAAGSDQLWGVLVTRDAFTPASAQKFSIKLGLQRE